MNNVENRFLLVLAMIGVALAGGAFALSWQPWNKFFDVSPANDGFVAPRGISEVVNETQDSTAVVTCEAR